MLESRWFWTLRFQNYPGAASGWKNLGHDEVKHVVEVIKVGAGHEPN